jgi:hypothetical protein
MVQLTNYWLKTSKQLVGVMIEDASRNDCRIMMS